jgi:hypothetical protein
MPTVTLPPPQYDHAYSGVVIERVLPLEEARSYCQQIGVGRYDACAGYVILQDGSKACFIVLPTDAPDPDISHYRIHERAHCNGWPASHRDE